MGRRVKLISDLAAAPRKRRGISTSSAIQCLLVNVIGTYVFASTY